MRRLEPATTGRWCSKCFYYVLKVMPGNDIDRVIRFWCLWVQEGRRRRAEQERLPPQEREQDACETCWCKLAGPLGPQGQERVSRKGREPSVLLRGVLIGMELAGK